MINASNYGYDVGTMALACLYRNLGKVNVVFGARTRAFPSWMVLVSLSTSGPLRPEDKEKFPIYIERDLWEYVCVPVMQDEAVMVRTVTGSHRNAGNVVLLERDPQTLLKKIAGALTAQLQVRGFIPQTEGAGTESTASTVGSSVSATAAALAMLAEGAEGDGEPIERGTDDGIRWPEGHLKLTYPEVD